MFLGNRCVCFGFILFWRPCFYFLYYISISLFTWFLHIYDRIAAIILFRSVFNFQSNWLFAILTTMGYSNSFLQVNISTLFQSNKPENPFQTMTSQWVYLFESIQADFIRVYHTFPVSLSEFFAFFTTSGHIYANLVGSKRAAVSDYFYVGTRY